ncbi:ABC transporter permease [Cytophagaceae bacterium YF14B1]|uniref:ABC transporter permease n=1 Tax=Xanthocytophaga flava TaxID=3048013 RepID=A0AAE3UCD2_9BACT|nr:ABC transporter permease [Xanthocytophaga flavus]MDJ1484624.1 ABC transporter permease [Xanthocytophaga flavus]
MFRNFLTVALRNIAKHKVFTLINVFGLSLGMAIFFLLTGYVRFENSYDAIHQHSENIYRVESIFYKGGEKTDDWAGSTNGYGPAMKANFPEVESFTRINWNSSTRVVRYQDTKFREQNVCFADSNFFTFFSYPVVKGNPQTFLNAPNTVVISEKAAHKYFGKEEPMGKFLDISTISKTYRCQVSGVFKDLPVNSSLQFDVLMSWTTSPEWVRNFWYQHSSYTYIRVQPNTNIANLAAKFPALAEKYKTADAMKEHKWAIDLVPLHAIHLNPAKTNEPETKGSRTTVQFLLIAGIIILIIGWVNYINLSTARAIDRAQEASIRKVLGSSSTLLVGQFLFESFILNFIALLVAIVFIGIGIWSLGTFLTIYIPASIWTEPQQYTLFAIIFPVGILISGIYPAFLLAKVIPVQILKGKYTFSGGGNLLRKSLVTLQFTTSLILIMGTLIAYKQISYMMNQQLGADIAQVMVVEAPVHTEGYTEKIESFKNELKSLAGVTNVTGSGAVPGVEVGEFLANRKLHSEPADNRLYEMMAADYDFIPTFDLTVIAGRNFDKSRPTDQYGLILNESAVKQFGFESSEKAIGEKILLEGNQGRANEIIGVIKDYHQQSLQHPYTPIILFMDPDFRWIPADFLSIKIQGGDIKQTAQKIEATWLKFFPESSFDSFFLDQFFNQQYKQEEVFGRVVAFFSSLAIFIACIGLFGLTSYNTTRRTKEIGIRKVLGASVQHIVSLLAWDTLRLILLAALLAIPIAWYGMSEWLTRYAFRIDINGWYGLLPVLVLGGIAFLTISSITIRAAFANPVKSLRNE